ncbi:MAG: superoxide dismutase family protein [Austwickia sp.]|jgi:Cu-Zn family superoxide dismutase|nr:MAG: superoxide dismutase family protein [Austwickia sp.]
MRSRSRTVLPALSVLSIAALLTAGCAGRETTTAINDGKAPWESSGEAAGGHGAAAGGTSSGGAALASGDIVDPAGKKLGKVAVSKGEHGLTVQVSATGMPAGFHGLHLHAVGKCEPKSADPANPGTTGDFLSAGGHLAGGGAAHPEHAGDLPVLFVLKDGSGSLTAATDRLTEAQLGQEAGVSLIVHAGPDNYGNIPTRYAAGGADAETKKAGDAGARIGCAVLKKDAAGASGAGSGSATGH